MKASVTFSFLFLLLQRSIFLFGQQGQWTWMKGDSALGSAGHYGLQGIPDPANTPPALGYAFSWVDLQGNFWLYGGAPQIYCLGDLWKYDVAANLWTWVKGPGTPNQPAVYGTQGIPSIFNTPGARWGGSANWTDSQGDLWLLGGWRHGLGCSNDLWRYHIATNEWTWMKGSQLADDTGFYGTITIAGTLNNPSARYLSNRGWTDNNGNFWLFGGNNNIYWYNDVWKYDENTNQWTWMHGASSPNQPGIYGLQNVPAPQNTPCSRVVNSYWVDSEGNFWLFGGNGYNGIYNDLWKFDPLSLDWAWISGANIPGQNSVCSGICQSSVNNIPASRAYNSACWKGNCDFLYLYGGSNNGLTGWHVWGDLWCFNRFTSEWTFVKGSFTPDFSGHHGMIGVSDSANYPRALMGSSSWTDMNGNFWMFGGGPTAGSRINELWRYTPDTLCPQYNTLVNVSISHDTTICSGDSTMLSASGGIYYQWTPESNISNPNIPNPIVYPINSATYTVAISNGSCHAALSVHVFVKSDSLFQLLTPDTTICFGDSIVLQAMGGSTYQWTPNSNINNPNIPNPIVHPDSTTIYSVLISDTCSKKAFTVQVFVSIDSLFYLLTHDTLICKGDSIALQAIGGNTYHWQPSYHLSDPDIPNPSACPDISTIYSVTISNDCFNRTFPVHVQVIHDTSMLLINNDTIVCQGQAFQLTATGGVQYSWNSGQSTRIIMVNPLVPTEYFVTITDIYGCHTSDSVMIHVNTLPVIKVASSEPSICQGLSVELSASGAMLYHWYPQEGLSGSAGNPVLATPSQTMIYTVTGTDQNGCSDTATVKVEVINCPPTIPNVFTPNADGKNDYFVVLYDGGFPYNIKIYNRWGIKLFESNDLRSLWDGRYKGNDVPGGTYYYLVTIGDRHYSGVVTLIR